MIGIWTIQGRDVEEKGYSASQLEQMSQRLQEQQLSQRRRRSPTGKGRIRNWGGRSLEVSREEDGEVERIGKLRKISLRGSAREEEPQSRLTPAPKST